ncbi:unnamed protein product [Amoebophrya sp. A120]|nr:unnamed protein product [Amoebophrya sp. A120]|eukprot:GSA120T00014914001.1
MQMCVELTYILNLRIFKNQDQNERAMSELNHQLRLPDNFTWTYNPRVFPKQFMASPIIPLESEIVSLKHWNKRGNSFLNILAPRQPESNSHAAASKTAIQQTAFSHGRDSHAFGDSIVTVGAEVAGASTRSTTITADGTDAGVSEDLLEIGGDEVAAFEAGDSIATTGKPASFNAVQASEPVSAETAQKSL